MKKTAVITGAAGVLCSVIAGDFLAAGTRTALLDINGEALEKRVREYTAKGWEARGYVCDVLDKDSLIAAERAVSRDFGPVDILINGAGGNSPRATAFNEFHDERKEGKPDFFALEKEGVDFVFNLNFLGTFLTTQVFAKKMAERGKGTILNISSMNAFAPLTRIPAYSAAKAAVSNFTKWLAVYFARSGIRVNAIAPGFFATEQNRTLLFNPDGSPTARTEKILRNTPAGRFGEPEELLGAVNWLCDDAAASFVTGVVIPVDGGFSAYSGV